MAGKKGMKGSGGRREGAGRKAAAPTRTLSYRVPEAASAEIDSKIRQIVQRYKKKPVKKA